MTMINDSPVFQHFDNITFSDLWEKKEDFINSYKELGFPQTYSLEKDNKTYNYLTDDDLGFIWLLMIGRFADSTIKSYNTYGAFQVRFMSRVWQHAPAWKKDLEIQNTLRSMSINDMDSPLYDGTKAIYNSAMNPGTSNVTTNTTNELPFINSQNVTKYKKSKIEGIALLTELLKKDVTEMFLRRFDDLFLNILYTGNEKLYVTQV